MNLRFEELDHNNLDRARIIDRSDVSEDFVDTSLRLWSILITARNISALDTPFL